MAQRPWFRTVLPPESPLLPALAVGLFAGRVLSEGLKPGALGAGLLTVLALVLAWLLCQRLPPSLTWPSVALLLYVFYPEPDPRLALAAVAFAIILAWQVAVIPPAFVVRVLPLIVFSLAFALYLITLAPGVLPADSGELQLVSATLGVAHPPGFALYTMLGHLFSRLPLGGSPAYNVNLFSALTSAATVTVVYLAVFRQTKRVGAGLVAATALGAATTFWSQATTANVRSLSALFAGLAIWLLLEIRQQRALGQRPDRLYPLLALTLSLGIVHHASLIFIAAVCLITLLWLDPDLAWSPRRWSRPALAGLLGLLPLLYFPLRATAAVPGADASLATVPGLLDHVLARGFSGDLFYFRSPAALWPRLKVMGNVLLFQFHPLLLGGMLLGLLTLARRDRPMAILLGGSFALHTLVTATYRAPQTVEYMLPAYIPAVLCLGIALGTRWKTSFLSQRAFLPRWSQLLAAALLLIALQQGIRRYPSFEWLHEGRTRAYIDPLLAEAPREGVVLADWHWSTPLWYLQTVEGTRPDLAIQYVFPTGEPYATTWAQRIGEAYATGRPVLATHYDAAAYVDLPPARPLGEAFLFPQRALSELPPAYEYIDVTVGDRIQLLGFYLEQASVPATHQANLTIAWRPLAGSTWPDVGPSSPVTLFAHLVGSDGMLYGQADEPARPQPAGVTLTRLPITPRPGAAPGDYDLLVGAYETASGSPLLDQAANPRTAITSLAVTAMELQPTTKNRRYRPLVAEERRLVGYDWDNTLANRSRLYLHWQTASGYVTEVRDPPARTVSLPAAYGPWGIPRPLTVAYAPLEQYLPLGQGIIWLGAGSLPEPLRQTATELTLDNDFAASRPVLHNLVVSTRLIGYQEDGPQWAWSDLHDGIPALGAIPTLKWIAGSRVRDPHFLEIAPAAEPGQTVGGLVTLYDAFTGRTLPVLDERIRQEFLGIPLAPTIISPEIKAPR